MKFVLKNEESAKFLSDFAHEKTEKGFEFDIEIESLASDATAEDLVNYVKYLDDLVSRMRESFRNELGYLWEEFYDHKRGHLPSVNSVEQLQRVVDVLGLSAEYEVEKKTLWV